MGVEWKDMEKLPKRWHLRYLLGVGKISEVR